MALLNLTGFLTGDGSEGTIQGAGATIQAVTTRNGSYALKSDPTGGGARGDFDFSKHGADAKAANIGGEAVYASVFVYITSDPSDTPRPLIDIQTPGGPVAGIKLTTAGNLQLYYVNGSGTATQIGSDTAVAHNEWVRLDVRATGTNTGGGLAVSGRLNKTEIGSSSSLTTSVQNTLFNVKFGFVGGAGVAYYSDVWLDDAAFPTDDYHIRIAVPTGDSATNTDWTASAGNKYACVDEIPPDGADYISSGTGAGAKDYSATHATAATLGVTGNIIGVKTAARMREATSTTTLGAVGIRSGSTDFATTEVDIGSTTVITMAAVYEVDPNTSAAWSASGFNAAEPLVRRSTSDTSDIRCEALYLMVAYAEAVAAVPFRRSLLGVGF